MAKKITAKQKAARRRNIAVARKSRWSKSSSKKKGPPKSKKKHPKNASKGARGILSRGSSAREKVYGKRMSKREMNSFNF